MPPAAARGAETAKPDPRVLGARYFDQAARWLRNGRAEPAPLRDFHADLWDVHMEIDKRKNDGYMRVWWKHPDKFRLAVRPQRPEQDISTKILDGERMWIRHPDGRVQRMHGSPGGAEAVAQLKEDRARLLDVAQFMTLDGLQVPGATFTFEGIHTGKKTLAGTFLHVRRRLAGARDMVFHFAFQKDPRDETGATLTATAPHVVHIMGAPEKKIEEEYYVLDRWKAGTHHPMPGRVQALARMRPEDRLERFLLAFPQQIRINAGIPDARFAPK